MKTIVIRRGEKTLAHHTTESSRSSYGQPVWTIEEEKVEPGPATWEQNGETVNLDVLSVKSGWLICRLPDAFLCGIIWSDGSYYADIIEDQAGNPLTTIKEGAHVRGSIQLNPDDTDDLGAVLR